MNLKKTIIFLLIILALGTLVFLVIDGDLTGRIVDRSLEEYENYKTYTKAVCNETNFCQDYQITCKDKEIINMIPITGASIQHSANWEDPRENKSEITCE